MAWCDSQTWLLNALRQEWYRHLLDATSMERVSSGDRLKILRPNAMPWELSRQGILKHLFNEKLQSHVEPVDAYMLVIPPGSRSGKHRHLGDESLYVAEGDGYVLYQDCDVEITDAYRWKQQDEVKRHDWKTGDVFYIPPNTVHQYFNSDPERPARLISATSCIYQKLGLNDIQQLEDAPEYRPGVVLNNDNVVNFMKAGRKKTGTLGA